MGHLFHDHFPTTAKLLINDNRHFQNKCDIVVETNSSSKYGIGVKFFSLILCFDEDMNQSESCVAFYFLGIIAEVTQTFKFPNYSGNV